MNSPDLLGWLATPRSFLWKLYASIVWIICAILIGMVLLLVMLPRPGPDMTPQQRGEMTLSANSITTATAWLLLIGIAAGVWVIYSMPKDES
jgi:hypothetical protein